MRHRRAHQCLFQLAYPTHHHSRHQKRSTFRVTHDFPAAPFRDLPEPGPTPPIILPDPISTSLTSAATECILAVVVFIFGQRGCSAVVELSRALTADHALSLFVNEPSKPPCFSLVLPCSSIASLLQYCLHKDLIHFDKSLHALSC
jgi:hypothetical protein